MAKNKKKTVEGEGVTLINLRTLDSTLDCHRIVEVITQASAEEAGVARVSTEPTDPNKTDPDSVASEICTMDMPMFTDASRFKYKPQPGDDIDVSGNASTLINL
jgi:hypothetical protein